MQCLIIMLTLIRRSLSIAVLQDPEQASTFMSTDQAVTMITTLTDVSVDQHMRSQLTCIAVVCRPEQHALEAVRQQIHCYKNGTGTIYKCLKLVAGDIAGAAVTMCNTADASQLMVSRVARLAGGISSWGTVSNGADDAMQVVLVSVDTWITVWAEVSALSQAATSHTAAASVSEDLAHLSKVCAAGFECLVNTSMAECNLMAAPLTSCK